MEMVFKEYGHYILGVIGTIAVIAVACFIIGLYSPNGKNVHTNYNVGGQVYTYNPSGYESKIDVSKYDRYEYGNGLLGYIIGKWLGRVM